jgi:hypothetical protein
MPLKDRKKRLEYQNKRYHTKRKQILEYIKKYQKKPEVKLRKNELQRIHYSEKNNVDKRFLKSTEYYDYETHHELAMNSGIESSYEWIECYKLGFFPIGIYRDPSLAFGSKGFGVNNAT